MNSMEALVDKIVRNVLLFSKFSHLFILIYFIIIRSFISIKKLSFQNNAPNLPQLKITENNEVRVPDSEIHVSECQTS